MASQLMHGQTKIQTPTEEPWLLKSVSNYTNLIKLFYQISWRL